MKLTTKLLVLAAGIIGGVGAATTGWAYWTSSGTGTASATVGTWKNDTTVALTSSANPSVVGQSVTYTATVTASGTGSPTGKVEFFAGATPISDCGGATGVLLSGSSAVCAQTYAAVGTHAITAQYLGDADFNASPPSSTLTQTVNQAATSTSLTVTGSPATYRSENAVVFTSTVTTGSGTPTGTVSIKQAGATLCSIALPASSCSPTATALNAAPTAYSVTAVYSGDSAYLGSTSAAQNLTVNKAKPVVTWPTPGAITYGTALGATQLNATADAPGSFAYNPAAGTVLSAGSHPLTVVFTPTDTINFEGTSAGVTLTVNKAPQTITFTSSAPTNATVGGPTYTATATGGASGNAVTFSLDGTSTGCSLAGSTVSFTAAGTCKINANQAGDANWSAATQVQQSFTVTAPFAVTSIASVNKGSTPGKAEVNDTFSVTFNKAVDPTTVPTATAQTLTICGKNACTPSLGSNTSKLTITGLTAGITVATNYVSDNKTAVFSGHLSLSADQKTVTFTIESLTSGGADLTTGGATTFTFAPVSSIRDLGGSSAGSFNQASTRLF